MSDLTTRLGRPPSRISAALLVGALAIATGVTMAAHADVEQQELRIRERADSTALEAMSRRSAAALHLALAIEDPQLAEETIERLMAAEPQLEGVRLRFADGESVSVGQFAVDAKTQTAHVTSQDAVGDPLVLGADVPKLVDEPAFLGAIDIASTNPSGAGSAEPTFQHVALASFSATLGLLGFALWFRRRVRRLAHAAVALSAGDFSAPAAEVGKDELGWAAKSLSDLSEVLAEQVDRVHGRNAALLRDVTLKEDHLQRLANFASRLVSPLGGETAATVSLEILCREADAEFGILFVPSPERNGRPLCAAVFGLPMNADDPRLVSGLPMSQPGAVQDFEVSMLSPEHPWMSGRNIPLHVSRLPLEFQGQPEGTVFLARRLAWSDSERAFVQDAARPFAIALANDRAFRATVSMARVLEDRNDALVQQRDQLAVVDRLRSQFVANMSHELRTPLNAIMGYTELLADEVFGPVSEEQRKHLEHVLDATNHLLGLVNQVLDLSRAEAGAIDVAPAPCDLLEVANEVAELAHGLCRDRPYVPEVRGEATLLSTDRTRVQQILTNLVGNAIKFTTSGSVTINVIPAVDGGAQVVVRDTGCGIDPAHAEVIFEEFRQADGSSTRAHDGVGLGLAISRRLAQALGGQLGVESALGRGSSFTLKLPASTPQTEPDESEDPSAPRKVS